MPERTISTRLVLNGERAYREQIANINRSLKTLNSELELTASNFRGQLNSMEALEAKQKTLTALVEKQAEKYQEEVKALQQAAQWRDEAAKNIENYRKELERLQGISADSAEEQAKLEKQVDKLSKNLANAESAQEKAARAVENHTRQANKAQIRLNELNDELALNSKYLDEARASADHCATSIDEFGKQASESKESAREFGQKSSEAIKTLASALVAAGAKESLEEIAEALTACVGASIEFQSAMAGVAKTTNLSGSDLDEMSAQIKELAIEIPLAASEIAGIAETAGQLGVAQEDIMAFVEVMANLGVTTNMSSEEAATAIARLSNILGTTSEDYERLGSVIVALGNSTATTESEIVEFSQRLASTGAVVGLTETQILGISAAMSSLGIEAEAGGSAISKLLKQFETMVQTGSGDLEKFAQVAGMSASEFTVAWGEDAVSALGAFIEGLADIDQNGGSAVKTLDDLGITEVRLSNAVLALANGNDVLTQALGTANTAWAENNALANEAAIRYETTESKIQLLNNAAENLKIAVGDQLRPALDGIAEAGANALNWAADFVAENDAVVAILGAVTAALGVSAVAVVGYTAATSTATPVITMAKNAVVAFNTALKSNPFGAIAMAITAAVSAIVTFVALLDDQSDKVDELNAGFHAAVGSIEAAEKAFKESSTTIEATSNQVGAYIDRLAELEAAGARTDEMMEEYNILLDRVRTALPDINLELDEQSGLLKEGAESLRRQAEEWKLLTLEEAYATKYKDQIAAANAAELELLETKYLLEQEEKNYQSIWAKTVAETEEYNSLLREQEDLNAVLTPTEEQLLRLDEIAGRMRELSAIQSQNTSDLNASLALQDTYNDAISEAEEEFAKYNGELEAAHAALEEMRDEIESNTKWMESATETTAELIAELDTMQVSTADLVDYVEELTAAMDEQADAGSLSIDTINKLIDNGYALALQIDEETGAVTLNADAYMNLATARIEEQIAALQMNRNALINKLAEESYAVEEAAGRVLALAEANYDLAISQYAADKETVGAIAGYDANIAALQKLKDSVGTTTRSYSSSSSSMRAETKKTVDEFAEMRKTLEHERNMELVTEAEYYEELKRLRDEYLNQDDRLEDWRSVSEEIYKYEQGLIQEATEAYNNSVDELQAAYNTVLDDIQSDIDNINSQMANFQKKLADYGEMYTEEDGKYQLTSVQEQLDTLARYGDALEKLKERGASDVFLGEVQTLGVDDAIGYAEELLKLSDDEWAEYLGLWEEKQAEAKKIAEAFYSDQLKTLETEYNSTLENSLNVLEQTAYSSGMDTVQGLINGMKAKQAELAQMAAELSRTAQTAYAEESDQHSPSRKMEKLGGNDMLGLMRGYEKYAQQYEEMVARSFPSTFTLPAQEDHSATMSRQTEAIINAMSTLTSGMDNSGKEITVIVQLADGTELARSLLPDLRRVSAQSPEAEGEKPI